MPTITPRRGPIARRRLRRLGLAALLPLAGCGGDAPPPPAPYAPPAPGTTYDYGDFSNTVTGVDGWRTTYTDDAGREGRRVGLFITEDPRRPLVVQVAALDSLWPLALNRRVELRTQQAEEVYTWQFTVVDTATVEVEAGTFLTYVVEGVHVPQLVRDPNQASTVIHTWWYAPEPKAVVRFESTYLAGPAKGRRFGATLRAIRTAAPGDSATPAGAVGAPDRDSAAGAGATGASAPPPAGGPRPD